MRGSGRLGLTAFLGVLASTVGVALTQTAAPRFEQRVFRTADGVSMRYGLSVPGDADASRRRPLVLALHPGGGGSPYYGDGFLRSVFLPGLRELAPIMIAPDVPGRSWTDPGADRLVMDLVAAIGKEFSIDERRVLVVGFSMGAAGTWHHSARHHDRFTAAIVMAGRTEEPLANLGRIPTYIIHSRDDQVVPFTQAEERARALDALGRPVRFEALTGVSHHAMGGYLEALARAGRWVSMQWASVPGKDSR